MIPDHGRDIDEFEFSTLDKFQQSLIQARRIVATWPAWKRNLLQNSLKPTTAPRQPVSHTNDRQVEPS
jgi:hypothetical protein